MDAARRIGFEKETIATHSIKGKGWFPLTREEGAHIGLHRKAVPVSKYFVAHGAFNINRAGTNRLPERASMSR
jgi:hypothetical protein